MKNLLYFILLLLLFQSCAKEKISNNDAPKASEKLPALFTKPKATDSETNAKDSLLVSNDLNIISLLSQNGKDDYFEKGQPLAKFLSFELVDKDFFEKMKQTSVNFVLADTVPNKKKAGVTELKCANKTIKLVDNDTDSEDATVFNYEGQIEFLNKYLLRTDYFEDGDYKLIDKTTGKPR